MSLGLKVPDNPAQFWEVDNAEEAGAALNQSAKEAGGSIWDKFGSFFSGAAGSAASGALSSVASATPYGAITAGINQFGQLGQAALGGTQTAEGGRIGGQIRGDKITYIVRGNGSIDGQAKTGMQGPFNPWLIGGVVLAGLVALKIMRG